MFFTRLLTAVPGPWPPAMDQLKLAFWRAVRTLIQGIAGAFGTGGVATAILTSGYWRNVSVALIAAGIAAGVSFLHNVATFLPADPTQVVPGPPQPQPPGPPPFPAPEPAPGGGF